MNSSISDRILRTIQDPQYRPQNKSELARGLNVPPKERAGFRKALQSLEKKGKIELTRKGRYVLAGTGAGSQQDRNTITGRIIFPTGGSGSFAFLEPDVPEGTLESERPDDYFIPPRATMTAMNGDRVLVRLQRKDPPKWHRHVKSKRDAAAKSDGKIEGKVLKILERGSEKIVGTYFDRGRFFYVQPDNPRLPPTFDLTAKAKGAKTGDKVVVELAEWSSPQVNPVGAVVKILGKASDPGVDILSVIYRFGLPLEFPRAVLDEAADIDEAIPEEEIARREDWRQKPVFTIDPMDAKDFDDAISVRRLDNGGGWELAVHIADVSHYVMPGTAMDKEASKRGNSVYLVDRVIPMLPEKLSNGICSLKPDVDRLTHAVVMEFDENGHMKKARYVSAIIRSERRFTYEEAFELLSLEEAQIAKRKPQDISIIRHLQEAWVLAEKIRKLRFKRGSLDLDFPEVKVILNEKGDPVELRKIEYDISHQLIEEFMLSANEAVAHFIKNEQHPSVYRIHEDPDPEKLEEFRLLARDHGIAAGDLTNRKELQRVLKEIRGRAEEHALKLSLLKSLKRAAYSPEPLGHYGLAKLNYTHFTSPIRRYADLLVHRALRKVNPHERTTGKPAPTLSQSRLITVSRHISDTERTAADAEQETKQMKIMEYLLGLARSNKPPTFKAVVNEVRPIGALIEIPDILVKGLVRREDFPSDDVWYDPAASALISRMPKFRVKIGDKIEVKIERVDLDRNLVDFRVERI